MTRSKIPLATTAVAVIAYALFLSLVAGYYVGRELAEMDNLADRAAQASTHDARDAVE
jgi:hypothetical protein